MDALCRRMTTQQKRRRQPSGDHLPYLCTEAPDCVPYCLRDSVTVEDLENRSRYNNLHILEIPEPLPQKDLVALCEQELTTALGLPQDRKVERAQRLGLDLPSKKSAKNTNSSDTQVIVKHRYYSDNTSTLLA